MKIHLLPEKGKFYKANLHCHTNVSDGKRSREEDTLTHAEFDIRPEDKYIRFTVTDKYGKTASTNAYFTDKLLN